jgi:glycosyltransferase involved in cell wall biosynthesis
MKILHTVESYLPAMHGMQKVVQQISEKLVLLGHEVTIATKFSPERLELIINGVGIESFKLSGNSVEGINGSQDEKDRYVNFVKNGNFDIVSNFAAQQWATDILLPHLNHIKSKKIFIPTGFSKLNDFRYKTYYSNMRYWMKAYDSNVFLSNDYQDIKFARENHIKKVQVIANAASYDEFYGLQQNNVKRRLAIKDSDFLILTIGSHTGSKGHAETIQMFKLAKLNNATLLVIGNNPLIVSFVKSVAINSVKKILNFFSFITKKKYVASCYNSCNFKSKWYNLLFYLTGATKKIIVKDMNRSDTLCAYAAADLFLFPSNIECSPLVLFEAMASKTPFLSSAAGNSIEIAELTKGGLILPTIKSNDGYSKIKLKESVVMLENLICNEDLRQTLTRDGYNAWLKTYTWEQIALQYQQLYLNTLSQ